MTKILRLTPLYKKLLFLFFISINNKTISYHLSLLINSFQINKSTLNKDYIIKSILFFCWTLNFNSIICWNKCYLHNRWKTFVPAQNPFFKLFKTVLCHFRCRIESSWNFHVWNKAKWDFIDAWRYFFNHFWINF